MNWIKKVRQTRAPINSVGIERWRPNSVIVRQKRLLIVALSLLLICALPDVAVADRVYGDCKIFDDPRDLPLGQRELLAANPGSVAQFCHLAAPDREWGELASPIEVSALGICRYSTRKLVRRKSDSAGRSVITWGVSDDPPVTYFTQTSPCPKRLTEAYTEVWHISERDLIEVTALIESIAASRVKLYRSLSGLGLIACVLAPSYSTILTDTLDHYKASRSSVRIELIDRRKVDGEMVFEIQLASSAGYLVLHVMGRSDSFRIIQFEKVSD